MKYFLWSFCSLFCNYIIAVPVLDLKINRLVSDDRGSLVDLVISNKTKKTLSFDMSDAIAKFDEVNFKTENDRVGLKYCPLFEDGEYGIMSDSEPDIVTLPSFGVTNTIFSTTDRIEGVSAGGSVLWQIATSIDSSVPPCTNKVEAFGSGCVSIIGRKEFFDCYPKLPSCATSTLR